MNLGMEHAMEDGYSPLGGLKTVPCDRWSEDSRVGSGFVCHAQQRADRKQLRTQVNEIRRSIDCRGYSIPDVWSMNRWRCRRRLRCARPAGLNAAGAA